MAPTLSRNDIQIFCIGFAESVGLQEIKQVIMDGLMC
jgi:hypothetical protein